MNFVRKGFPKYKTSALCIVWYLACEHLISTDLVYLMRQKPFNLALSFSLYFSLRSIVCVPILDYFIYIDYQMSPIPSSVILTSFIYISKCINDIQEQWLLRFTKMKNENRNQKTKKFQGENLKTEWKMKINNFPKIALHTVIYIYGSLLVGIYSIEIDKIMINDPKFH